MDARLALQVLAILVLGLMCGSELNVAAFGHPTLNRQTVEVHIPVRSSLAVLFGRVMPFWMAGSTLLNLLLLLPFEGLSASARRLAAISFAIQAAAVVFSVLVPVPINNRIKKWTPNNLPENWIAQERRWDGYHWFRTCGLIVAFSLLILSLGAA
jgi:anthrone oxygenase-like protein